MSRLQLYFLGSVKVTWGDQPLHIPRRKTRALLYYLALESTRGPVPRPLLRDLLWEEALHPSRRLSETITRLKNLLPDPTLLIRTPQGIGLDHQQVWVDALAFVQQAQRLEAQAQQWPTEEALPPDLLQQWREALALWQSPDPFQGLDDDFGGGSFGRWLTHWRGLLTALRDQGYRRLAFSAWHMGEYAQAAKYAIHFLHYCPTNQEMLCLALRAHREAGELTEARRLWAYIQERLEQDDLTLEEEVRRECEQLVSSWPALPLRAADIAWRIRPSLRLPLIGRDEVLSRLHRAVQQGRSVILQGEAGQGKTTLMEQVALQWRSRRFVLVLSGHEGEQNLTLQPWVDALMTQIPDQVWERLARRSEVLAPLLALAPGLQQRFPNLKPPDFVSPEHMEALINQALATVAQMLSYPHPLLLIVDDLHWADRATWRSLQFLLARPPFRNRRATALLALRGEEVPQELQHMLRALRSDYRVEQFDLTPLDREALQKLAQEALDRSLDPEELDYLTRTSGGNPFFALEILRHWQTLALQGLRPLDHRELPSSMHDLVLQRLDRLSPPARQALEAASLIGATFAVEVLRHAFGWDQEAVIALLEALENQHLVEPAGEGTYRFVHEAVREIVVAQLPEARAWRLHRSLATALEALWGERADTRAAVLATHYERAGEVAKAFHWWLRAALRAIRLGDRQEGYDAFARAEELLLQHEEDFGEEEIWALYDEWANLAAEVDDAETVERLSRRLLELGRQRHSLWLQGVGEDGLSEAALIRNQYQEGLEHAIKATELLRLTGKTFDLIEALANQAVFYYMQGFPNKGSEKAREAVALGDPLAHDPRVARALGDALYELSVCLLLLGEAHEAKQTIERAMALYDRVHRPYGQAGALSVHSFVRYYLGEYAQGAHEAQQAAQWLRGLQKWRLLGYAYLYRAMNLLDWGYIGPAWEAMEKAREIGQVYHHGEITATAWRLQGDVFLALGYPDQAQVYYQQAYEAAADTFVAFNILARMGLAHVRNGQPEAAAMFLGGALHQAEDRGAYLLVIPARLVLTAVALYSRHLEMAQEQAQLALEASERLRLPVFAGWAYLVRGYLSLLTADADRARAWFRRLVERYEQVPTLWNTLYALYGLRLLEAWGEKESILLGKLRQLIEEHLWLDKVTSLPYREAAQAFLARWDQGDFGPLPGWKPVLENLT